MPLDDGARAGVHLNAMRTTILLGTLALVAAFAAGFAFNRWLHRPTTAGGMTLQFVANSVAPTPPRPIPPCMITCTPPLNDPAGDGPDTDDATQASCYGDGSIPCPGARRPRPYGDCKRDDVSCSPEEQECWWAMGDNYCQQET